MKLGYLIAALATGLAGAAGAQAPGVLSGPDWQVVALAGGPLPDGVQPSIAFSEGARVAGQSGCNRYMGGYQQDGYGLTFSQLAGTRMACPPPQMETEQRMFDALEATRAFALTPGGALELLGADGTLILRATR